MRQLVQPAGGGAVQLVSAPIPHIGSTEVLVKTRASLISAGTERAVTQLAQEGLLGKARARPDLVRQVVHKARQEGLRSTVASVRSRLAEDLPLGYAGCGEVVQVGAHVRGIRVGQLVATGGAGYACHAEYQRVPGLLCVPVPAEVTPEAAAFATVAAVGLHGLRLAEAGPGAKVVIVGLGLVGQLSARIALASGCDVVGIDVRDDAVDFAREHGVIGLRERGEPTTREILEWSRGRGADAVIITAGAKGDSSILDNVPSRCRDRAIVAAIGDVGLDVPRNDFYLKELRLEVPRSYGPGRYDLSYEEWAVDYPVGHVRWTEGRNIEAVLDMLNGGKLNVVDLITHRVDIDEGPSAYDLLSDPKSEARGIVLAYPDREREPTTTVRVSRHEGRAVSGSLRVGIIGSGLFVRSTILPAIGAAGLGPVVHIASASGVTASRVAERNGIPRASSNAEAVVNDPEVDLVVIATPHSSHASLVVQALEAGKHVYCEKPLAITKEQLASVVAAYERNDGILHVGFNRRHSPMVVEMTRVLSQHSGPINIVYRVNAGPLAKDHWYGDRREGGRLIGEGCHFVDTCNALVGDLEVRRIYCASPNSDEHDSYTLLVEYEDGSTASIIYAADGFTGTTKERCEVLGRGHTMVLDDYRSLAIDGAKVKVAAGKGHVMNLRQLVSERSSSLGAANAIRTFDLLFSCGALQVESSGL